MELHQVRYCSALCKTLNFTRAAEACNVTQPALTRQHFVGKPVLALGRSERGTGIRRDRHQGRAKPFDLRQALLQRLDLSVQ